MENERKAAILLSRQLLFKLKLSKPVLLALQSHLLQLSLVTP